MITGSSSPPRPLAYNLVRLVFASMQTTPRGIDRIDLGYLSALFERWPAGCYGVLPSLIGMRAFDRERVLRARDRLVALWQEGTDTSADDDPSLKAFKMRFANNTLPEPMVRERRVIGGRKDLMRMLRWLLAEGMSMGAPLTSLPSDTIYLDVGHFGLTMPGSFHWRRKRPDIAPVFMIHDAIPLERPDMVAAETVKAHRRLMAIAAREAAAIITPTVAAAEAIGAELASLGRRDIPLHPLPLPIDDLFSHAVEPDAELTATPYFVVCGAIEPRKNHALLFEVWRQLEARLGAKAPRLVIAGSPGYRGAEILAACPQLCTPIRRVSGLSSPALARVMAGARAVLMPSFAEGFGLPPLEALAMAVPAVVSDIPAHREAMGAHGTYLPVDKPDAWVETIVALMLDDTAHRDTRAALSTVSTRRWGGYISDVAQVLHTLPHNRG